MLDNQYNSVSFGAVYTLLCIVSRCEMQEFSLFWQDKYLKYWLKICVGRSCGGVWSCYYQEDIGVV
jgi:hypothetical protein